MLTYYYDYNLRDINTSIINNEIIPHIKKTKTQKNNFYILTKNHTHLDNLKKELLKECGVIQVSPLITIQEFYNKILRTILTTTNKLNNYATINKTNKTILMKEVIDEYKDKEKYLKKVLNLNNFQKELLYIITAIKKECENENKHPFIIDINDSFAKWKKQVTEEYPNLIEKYDAISKILDNYTAKQKEYSLVDNQDIIHIIKNILEEGQTPLIRTKTIYLFGITSLSTLEIKLLESLSKIGINIIITIYFDPKRESLFYKGNQLIEKLKQINFKAKSIPTSIETNGIGQIKDRLFTEDIQKINTNNYPIYQIKGENPKNEIIQVAKQINNILRKGNKLNTIAIVDRNPAEYQDYIYNTLKQYNIPINSFHKKNLINKQLINIILNIVELRLYNFRGDLIIPFIRSSYTYINKALTQTELPESYNTNKIVDNILYYYNNTNKDVFLYFEELIEKAKKQEDRLKEKSIKECLIYLNKLKEIISLLPKTSKEETHIYEIIKTLKMQINSSFSILYNTYNGKDLTIIKEDAIALKSFFYLLDELSFIYTKKGSYTINLNKFYQLLKEAIANHSFYDKKTNTNAIYYCKPSDTLNLSFSYIFVIGMTEGNFPQKLRQSALFSGSEKRIINTITGSIFPSADEQINDEDFIFFNTINAAQKEIFFSYPIRNNKLKETLPSFYFNEVKVKEIPHSNEINSLSELLEHYGKITLESNKDFDQNLIPKETRKLIHSKAKMEYYRDKVDGFNEYEGMLYHQKIPKLDIIESKLDNKLTATQIERYGQCPHRFFFYDIIGLRRKQDIIDTIEPSTRGVAAHYILYAFYKDNPSTDINEYLNKDKSLKTKVRENIIKITKEYFAKQTEERKLSNLYSNSREVNEITNKVLIFIRNDILNNNDYKRHLLELDFNSENSNIPLTKYKGKDINIKCTIDRIDIEKEKSKEKINFRIIDYKYKSSSTKETAKTIKNKLEQGLYFQPIVYTKVGIDLLKDYKLEKWYYYYIANSKSAKTKLEVAELNPFDKIKGNKKENYIERGLYYINKYLELIDEGQFPVNPRDCSSYCEFKDACRVNIPLSKTKEDNIGFWEKIVPADTEN